MKNEEKIKANRGLEPEDYYLNDRDLWYLRKNTT
jgi:hypothetical protein